MIQLIFFLFYLSLSLSSLSIIIMIIIIVHLCPHCDQEIKKEKSEMLLYYCCSTFTMHQAIQPNKRNNMKIVIYVYNQGFQRCRMPFSSSICLVFCPLLHIQFNYISQLKGSKQHRDRGNNSNNNIMIYRKNERKREKKNLVSGIPFVNHKQKNRSGYDKLIQILHCFSLQHSFHFPDRWLLRKFYLEFVSQSLSSATQAGRLLDVIHCYQPSSF